MADRFLVIPAYAASGAHGEFADPHAAAVEASSMVERDRVPRVVVQLVSEIRASPVPKLDIVQIADIARTAGVSDG